MEVTDLTPHRNNVLEVGWRSNDHEGNLMSMARSRPEPDRSQIEERREAGKLVVNYRPSKNRGCLNLTSLLVFILL